MSTGMPRHLSTISRYLEYLFQTRGEKQDEGTREPFGKVGKRLGLDFVKKLLYTE